VASAHSRAFTSRASSRPSAGKEQPGLTSRFSRRFRVALVVLDQCLRPLSVAGVSHRCDRRRSGGLPRPAADPSRHVVTAVTHSGEQPTGRVRPVPPGATGAVLGRSRNDPRTPALLAILAASPFRLPRMFPRSPLRLYQVAQQRGFFVPFEDEPYPEQPRPVVTYSLGATRFAGGWTGLGTVVPAARHGLPGRRGPSNPSPAARRRRGAAEPPRDRPASGLNASARSERIASSSPPCPLSSSSSFCSTFWDWKTYSTDGSMKLLQTEHGVPHPTTNAWLARQVLPVHPTEEIPRARSPRRRRSRRRSGTGFPWVTSALRTDSPGGGSRGYLVSAPPALRFTLALAASRVKTVGLSITANID